jgi:hypothetical protein
VSKDESNNNNARNNRDELWIDYLENDLEGPLKEDLELILDHSAPDRKRLESFKIAKSIVKASALKVDTKNDLFFEKMHKNIMGNLEQRLDENVVVLPQRKRSMAVAAAIVLVLVGSSLWWSLKYQGQIAKQPGDIFVSTSALDLDTFSDSLINNQSDSDFMLDVASQKINTLSHDETASVFNELME